MPLDRAFFDEMAHQQMGIDMVHSTQFQHARLKQSANKMERARSARSRKSSPRGRSCRNGSPRGCSPARQFEQLRLHEYASSSQPYFFAVVEVVASFTACAMFMPLSSM